LSPVARRWKTQFNENGKGWAYFEVLPEMDHNALSGIHSPADMAGRVRVLFLQSKGLHPRNQLRLDLTQQILEDQGVACHQVAIPGESSLSQILAAVQLGDYVSCYLAALYGSDPTDIGDIIGLKRQMS
jgi:glucose/mannose-6-phosphate isomerase